MVERVVIFAAMIWDQLAVGWYAPLTNAHLLTIVKSAYIDMVNQYLVPNLRNVIEANEPRNVIIGGDSQIRFCARTNRMRLTKNI